MHSTSRKITSLATLVSLVAQFVVIPQTYATLDAPSVRINNIGQNTWNFAPGDRFSLDASVTNDSGEALSGAVITIDFGNNTSFEYQGIDQRTRINSVTAISPVPASAWTSTGLITPITDFGHPTVGTGVEFGFYRASTSFTGFLVHTGANTYQNTVTTTFSAARTSDNSVITGTPSVKTIYLDVKPHITGYSFRSGGAPVSSIIQTVGTVDLVVTAKDNNGCTDLSGGSATADLSSLGLTSSENLSFVSCDDATKVATFSKTGISTSVGTGSYTFSTGSFFVFDSAANQNDPADPRF